MFGLQKTNGPWPMQLVVVRAVMKAVRAATIIQMKEISLSPTVTEG